MLYSSPRISEVAQLVLDLMPDASREERTEATRHLREYLAVVYRIFTRLEREGRLHEIRNREDEYQDAA